MARLAGKVAIITGAASGQGAAAARLFAAEGAFVVLTDVQDGAGGALARDIGDRALYVHLDVADPEQWRDVVDRAVDVCGRIDILLNNAGLYRPMSFGDTDLAVFDLHYRVNAQGVFLGMKAVTGAMIAVGGGAIVNTASAAGMRGYPGVFAYAASKWMVRGMSKSAAADLAIHNIRVNCILPGLIDTPMLAQNAPDHLEAISKMPPMQRLGTASEVAEAALYLASSASSYTTGAEIAVCGGMIG